MGLELELEKLEVGSMDPWTVCHKFDGYNLLYAQFALESNLNSILLSDYQICDKRSSLDSKLIKLILLFGDIS
jgi:hypothetical protein